MAGQKRKLESSKGSETVSIDALKQELSTTERLNRSKWMELIDKVNSKGNPEEMVETYESYLKIFNNDGEVWRMYISFELSRDQHEKVEQLFSQNLMNIYDVELWRLYIEYVRKVNNIVTGGDQARAIVTRAFNFAIDNVGLDFLSAQPIWRDYLQFLAEWSPLTTTDTRTKVEQQRNLYKKFISTPLKDLEENWKLYLTFENETNQSTARNFINERSPEYMKLRAPNQELSNITRLIKPIIQKVETKKQLSYWSSWIHWEKSNKLNLSQEKLDKRVDYVYRLSTQYLEFQPEVWYNYATYLISKSDTEQAQKIIEVGLLLNPDSFSLTFLQSNQYEKQSNMELVKQTWLSLINILSSQYESSSIDESEKLKLGRCVSKGYSSLMGAAKRLLGTKEARSIFAMARKFEGKTWHIFVDYAMMEYNSNELRISLKSWELALKYFSKDFGFIESYLNFLISQKDLANTKKVFELSLENFKDDKESLYKIFKKFMKIELSFGDVNSISLLEKRFCSVFTDESPFTLVSSSFEDDDTFNVVRLIDQYDSNVDNKTAKADKDVAVQDNKRQQLERLDVDAEMIFQLTNQRVREPFTVRDEMYNLMRVLPKSEYYVNEPTIFDPSKTVEFFQNIEI